MNNHIYQTNYGPLIVLETMGHKARGRFVETNYERTFWLKDLKTGRVRDLYYRSVLDVGYLGEGPYSHLLTHKVYHDWYDMFRRCYDLEFKAKNKTYKECYVDERPGYRGSVSISSQTFSVAGSVAEYPL